MRCRRGAGWGVLGHLSVAWWLELLPASGGATGQGPPLLTSLIFKKVFGRSPGCMWTQAQRLPRAKHQRCAACLDAEGGQAVQHLGGLGGVVPQRCVCPRKPHLGGRREGRVEAPLVGRWLGGSRGGRMASLCSTCYLQLVKSSLA